MAGDDLDGVHPRGGAADHDLAVVVLRGDRDQRVADQLDQQLRARARRGERGQVAVGREGLHGQHPVGDDAGAVLDRVGTGGHQRGDLAEAVAHQDVRAQALRGQHLVRGEVAAVDGELGHPRVVAEQIGDVDRAGTEQQG